MTTSEIGIQIRDELRNLDELKKSTTETFNKIYNTVVTYIPSDFEGKDNFIDLLEKNATLEQKCSKLKTAVSLTKEELLNMDEDAKKELTSVKIEKIIEKHLNELPSETCQNKAVKIEELRKMWATTQNGNQEASDDFNESSDFVMVTDSIETFIDPISKKRIEDPVKSKYCNHYFERKTILEYVKNNSKKCPNMGCNRYIAAKDLVNDPDAKARILAQQKSL